MKKIFTLFSVMLVAMSLQAGELTVADGSATNASLPVCTYYFDLGFQGQMLYNADELASLATNPISGLTFYANATDVTFGAGTISVKMAEVEESALSSSALTPEFTEVYSGACAIVGGEMVITFATPFTYSGAKNLLVEIKTTKNGSATYNDTYFYGQEVAASSFSTRMKQGTYSYGSDVADFLPKTTFTYTGGEGPTCNRPTQLACSDLTPDGGVFTWKGEENSQYQVCVVATGEEANEWKLLEANGYTYTVKGLTAGTTYDFYVRTYCSESEQSTAVKATFTPVCNAPAKVDISELTHNSVSLSWSAVAGISKYQYLCLPADSTPNWEDVKEVETLTVTVDTLQPSTTYDFYVRSYFNAETQSEATKVSFTTNCVAEALPYVETFSTGSMPNCWVAGSKWTIDISNTDYTLEGNNGFLRYNSGAYSEAVSPSIELSEKALLNFYYQNRYSTSAIDFDIIVLDASNETELYRESVTTPSPNETWVQKTIDLSAYTGKTIKIKFHGKSYGKGYIRIDDLSVTVKPCEMPKQLKADASSTGAVVTWAAGSDEAEWNLRYRAVGDEDWKEVKELAEPTYTLSGLVSGTEYEVQVQASCSTDKQSGWTTSAIFTPQCPVPSNLRVSQITDTEALVTWDGTEATYNLQYREKNTEEWTTLSAIEGKETLLNELSGTTSYEVQVQSACEGAFSSVKTFTTACAPLSNAIPFAEDFEEVEEGSLPSCWTRRTESEYPMVMSTKGAYGIKEDSDSTANCLVFNGEGEQVVILPAFDAPLNAHALAFYYKVSSSAVEVEVGYLTHLYGTFQVIKTLDNTVYAYAEPAIEVVLNELPEDAKYLAIRYTSTSQWSSSHFDNISIADPSPTGMENIHTTGKAIKRIENGMLILEYNGTIFDATGKKVYTK